MKVKVLFARIDARDDPYTRYSPVGFVVDSVEDYVPFTQIGPKVGRLSLLMEREYLTEMKKLQDRIAEKYELLAAAYEEDPPLPEEEVWGNGMTEANYAVCEADAKVMYPGPEADYYT